MSDINDGDIERIYLGYDLLRAEIIKAAATDAGFTVQLVRNVHPETGGFTALSESYLLVRSADVDAVRRIIEDDAGSEVTTEEE